MTQAHHADLIILGAGIAGLWTLAHYRSKGYNAVMLETESIGCGQTIASQGILHSGLKYAFAGKINALAKSISAMPDRWREAFNGKGHVDLSSATLNAETQYMLIPGGLMGGLMSLVTRKALGNNVRECSKEDWPDEVKSTGFDGHMVFMDEPVIDTPSVLRALAEPHRDVIRKIDWNDVQIETRDDSSIDHITIGDHHITAQHYIFTSAASNHRIASALGHDTELKTQARPLVQGMMKNAPYELYAHLVGPSDKPVATITTHKASDGTLVWYLGGGVAERMIDAPAQEVYDAIKAGFSKYLPKIDLDQFQYSTLPINRIEGRSKTQNHMPDTPTIHEVGNALYCWPTKLTFAPLLADMLEDKINNATGGECNLPFLPQAEHTQTPWDDTEWTNL